MLCTEQVLSMPNVVDKSIIGNLQQRVMTKNMHWNLPELTMMLLLLLIKTAAANTSH